jgi:SpoVK/Ycf46/Vps4 family AAA+-type ATPase
MARSDLVKRMLQSYQSGNDPEFRRVAEEVIADERRKRHDALADDLERILETRQLREGRRPLHVSTLKPLPTTRDDLPLLQLVQPRTKFHDLVLRSTTAELLREVVSEYQRRDILAAHSLEPRSKLLFVGPPGCGKSQSAEAIATAVGLPLAKVQLSTVVSSFLGETARHLEQILTFCEHGNWVLLFDELDTLAKERSDRTEHGELHRVVAAFLQLLDDYSGDALVIATSNHPTLLDEAAWRRFDEVVGFPLPNQAEIAELFRVKLRLLRTRFSKEEAARRLKGSSHAEVEMVCLDAARQAVLEGHDVVTTGEIDRAIRRMEQRQEEVKRFLP